MVVVLTGPVHSGKTTFLRRLVNHLIVHEVGVGGFLAVSLHRERECRGYDLFDIREGKSIPYIRTSGEEGWERVGSFYFLPEGLSRAKDIIRSHDEKSLLVVDEVGPLELGGWGVWPALRSVLDQRQTRLLLVMRESILEELRAKVRKHRVEVFDVRDSGAFNKIVGLFLEADGRQKLKR